IHSIRRDEFRARQFGQYQLKDKLGSGGMGEVYRAEHTLLKRPCAVKLIQTDDEVSEELLARFEKEVRSTAMLSHPHTVEVYDFGHTADGTFYYVMELLPGMSLDALVRRHGPMPPERAVHFLRQVCGALREAHAVGLIHRDIKPANIIAAERGGIWDFAKVLDFGLVREVPTGTVVDPRLTTQGMVGGSPYYMPPEQVTAFRDANARSDLYSLGGVGYFLLTGRPPFSARRPTDVLVAHSRGAVVAPSEHNPEVPQDLEQILLRCLAKDPGDRYADVSRLDDALADCACSGQWTDERAAAWWRGNQSAT
ncbi:MAG: serine/threonine-protein kinase, partial [Acidobacteriota bacterium]